MKRVAVSSSNAGSNETEAGCHGRCMEGEGYHLTIGERNSQTCVQSKNIAYFLFHEERRETNTSRIQIYAYHCERYRRQLKLGPRQHHEWVSDAVYTVMK